MNRRVFSSILMVLSLLAATSISRAQNTFEDPQGRFAIDLPKGWQLAPQTDDKVFVFQGEGKSIIIECLPMVNDPAEIFKKAETTVRLSGMAKPTLEGEVTELTLNGLPARWGIYKGSMAGVVLMALCGGVANGENGLYFLSFVSVAELSGWTGKLGKTFQSIRGHGQKVTGVENLNAAGDAKPVTPAPPGQTSKAQTTINSGDSYRLTRDYARAIAYYSEAIELDPRAVEVYLKRAWTYLDWEGKADYDKALADAAKVIELDPANKLAHFARGKVYLYRAHAAKKAENRKEADGFFDKALADLTLARGADFGSVKLFPNYSFFHNHSGLEVLVDIGHAYYGKGDLDRALGAYSSAYEKDPHYSLRVDWALRELFYEYSRQKRVIDFGNAPRTLHLAGCYWTKGNPNLAIRCFSRALELGMEPWQVYPDRSQAYAELGDFANAIADADNVLRIYQWDSFYVNRAKIYEKKGDFGKAISDYTEAIKAQRRNVKRSVSLDEFRYEGEDLIRLYFKRGELYMWSGSFDEALADLKAVDKMTDPGPAKAPLYRLIASIYQHKGDTKNANKYLQKAQAMNPDVKK